MAVTMEALQLGERYSRPQLAFLWGYRDWHAIGRGVVTPAGSSIILLFVTREKQESLTPYQDHLDGDILHWEGPQGHGPDQRIANAATNGDTIYLFYRDRHHQDFTYYGSVHVLTAELSTITPSRFTFSTRYSDAVAESSLQTEAITHGDTGVLPVGDVEGQRRLAIHVSYERSATNRAAAIRIHGTTCHACGFDFDAVYGPDHARSYIEIHHVKPLADGVTEVNPATDLVPLCSNCHSMAHRTPRTTLTVAELRDLLKHREQALGVAKR